MRVPRKQFFRGMGTSSAHLCAIAVSPRESRCACVRHPRKATLGFQLGYGAMVNGSRTKSMLRLLFVLLILLGTTSAFALTQGPFNPATCTNDASTGTIAWSPATLPAQVALKGNNNDVSNFLKCTGYGFTIPAGSVIDGITVTVNRSESRAGMVQDVAMRIVKNGTIGATDRSNAAFWPTAAGAQTYGSAADLWGNTWTVADINAANFGAAISAE